MDGSQRIRVEGDRQSAVESSSRIRKGDYTEKPLGNKRLSQLSGLMKVKLKSDGIRIVYKLERIEHAMRIVVIGVRSG